MVRCSWWFWSSEHALLHFTCLKQVNVFSTVKTRVVDKQEAWTKIAKKIKMGR